MIKNGKLKVVKIPKYLPEAGMVSLLSSLKKDVDAGKINSLFVVAGNLDGAISSGWHVDNGGKVFTLLGGIESTKRRFCEKEID